MVLTAGEWLGLAERTRALAADLAGSVLAPHWPQSLELLAKDCELEAGAEGEREVEAFWVEHPERRAA